MTMKTFVLCAAMLAGSAASALAQAGVPGAHFIENWDADADGVVSLQELEERRSDVFTAFDADENGKLDAEEYVYFDEARANDMAEAPGNGRGMRHASEGMTLLFNDGDGDGVVSREEFIGKTGDWLALLDRDADGAVTSGDFGRN